MGKYALLIGVGDYFAGLEPLPAATRDAAALAEVLQDPTMGEFDEVKVIENPTRAEMAREIELWFQEREPPDMVLLFFSGHGLKDEYRVLHFAASDTEKVRDRLLTATAIPANFVREVSRRCRAKHQIIILDCCFSGAFGDTIARDDGGLNLKAQLGAEGHVVLTSTNAVSYSFEYKGSDTSIYTRYLVEGIKTGAADEDTDGVITVEELHRYASRKTREASSAMSPEIFILKGEGYRIHLARSPQDSPKLKYRKEVERRIVAAKFTPPARRILKLYRQQIGISDAEAEVIELEVLRLNQEYQRKLQDYQGDLEECFRDEPALSSRTIEDLLELRNQLNLKQEDANTVECVVLKGRTLESYTDELKEQTRALSHQKLLKEHGEEKPKQKEQDKSQIAAEPNRKSRQMRVESQTTNTLPPDSNEELRSQRLSSKPLSTENSSFEIVRIDAQGEEIERRQAQITCQREALGNGVILELVNIPGGSFMMGTPQGERWKNKREKPQHEVKVGPFLMGRYPVTQIQWNVVSFLSKIDLELDSNPSKFKGKNHPVECVNWYEAIEFCKRLSYFTGREYRLPTEAEWEYACRATTTTHFHFGEAIRTSEANYSSQSTTAVNQFSCANAFGLSDMHGNIFEWCQDTWNDHYIGAPTDGRAWLEEGDQSCRVIRGGCWSNDPIACRSAYRCGKEVDSRDDVLGLRVVVSIS